MLTISIFEPDNLRTLKSKDSHSWLSNRGLKSALVNFKAFNITEVSESQEDLELKNGPQYFQV